MMEPGLREIMTEAARKKERNGTGTFHLPSSSTHKVTELYANPIYNPNLAGKRYDEGKQECTFSGRTATWALEKFVGKSDQMVVRERIRNNYE